MESQITLNKKQKISPYLLVILSFIGVILVGSFLLCLPFAHTNGEWGNYVESLYTATSATCVTGFDLYNGGIASELTFFGQLIILILIQIGGLGFITVLMYFITLFKRKLSFRDRAYISQAVSSTNIADVAIFVKKIFYVTIVIELLGMCLGLPIFLSVYDNPLEAIWASLFIAVSAFNNAGFDIFGGTSFHRNSSIFSKIDMLNDWQYHYFIGYIIFLVVLGGLSFLVLFEVFSFKKKPKQWRAFTKICLTMTFSIIIGGSLLLMLTDGFKAENPITYTDALFQSVTARTAGFTTFDPYNLTIGGRIVSCIIMFIGGSPLGTAGGIKTTTVFIILVTIVCYIRGKKVVAFKRFYSQNMIVKSMAVTIISIFVLLIGYFAICSFEVNNPICTGERALYEVIAGFSTTGFTTDLTATLSIGSRLIMVVLMFVGRLGPMTLFQVFSSNMNVEEKTHFRYVEEDILIG